MTAEQADEIRAALSRARTAHTLLRRVAKDHPATVGLGEAVDRLAVLLRSEDATRETRDGS